MKAKIADALINVRTRPYTHNVALTAGDVIVVNGSVMVAINETAANMENVFAYRGRMWFSKKAALALGVNTVCYLDVANSEITDDPAGNTKAGTCDEFAAAAATEVLVMLGENK